MLYYRSHKEARYNDRQHRAELEMLRESFERKIYDMTHKLMSTESRWVDLNHMLVSQLKKQPEVADAGRRAVLPAFLSAHGLGPNELEIDKDLVFVLTPFNKQHAETFDVIADAVRQVGFRCLRGDEERIDGDLLPHILRLIARARIVIANIDGRNPNVFYELGIAHALGKVTIMVTKSIKAAPTDLKAKKLIVYETREQLNQLLQRELARTLIDQSDRADA